MKTYIGSSITYEMIVGEDWLEARLRNDKAKFPKVGDVFQLNIPRLTQRFLGLKNKSTANFMIIAVMLGSILAMNFDSGLFCEINIIDLSKERSEDASFVFDIYGISS